MRFSLVLVAVFGFMFASCSHDQEQVVGTRVGTQESVRPGINDKYFEDPDPKKWSGTFETESREIFADREKIADAIGLKPGLVVADVGAGTGLFEDLFIRRVGQAGKVYAVDIVPEFLAHIRRRMAELQITNVETVLCTPTSIELPPHSVDVVFLCDTYHHFEFPKQTLASIQRALRPGGQLIVIDFIRVEGISRPWILDHVRAGEEVFTAEIEAAGFRKLERLDFLKENYFLRFER